MKKSFKKIITLIMLIALLTPMISFATNENPSILYGDVNCDSIVDDMDTIYLKRYLAGWEEYALTEEGKTNADVDLDGLITTNDRTIIERHICEWEGYETLPYLSEIDGSTIIIYTNTNKDVYNLGENVKVTVNWESHTGSLVSYSDVQAIGFTLQYDENKLEFIDATFNEVAEDATIHEQTLDEDFYNAETPGTVILSKI